MMKAINKTHLDKAGNPITSERITKFDPMAHKLIRKFLPARALFEASMNYEDLLNKCRFEVFMALKNKFDPVLAMTSTIMRRKLDESGQPIPTGKLDRNGRPQYVMEPDEERRAAQIAKKLGSPGEALTKAESNIVYGRLANYLRRTRYEYHPDQRGGRSVSMDGILEGIQREEDNNLFTEAASTATSDMSDTKALLIEVMEEQGPEAARMAYLALPAFERDRLLEHIECVSAGTLRLAASRVAEEVLETTTEKEQEDEREQEQVREQQDDSEPDAAQEA
jgi:hypothetical protein